MTLKQNTKKLLVFDIEVAPMEVRTWRLKIPSGYIPPENIVKSSYVLSFAARWYGDKEVEFHHVAQGEMKMLKRMAKLLEQADAIIHYNGKKFDVPVLMGEFLLKGVEPPKNFPVQIDLLPMARRVFMLPSYKLDFVCQILGIGAKARHKGYDMWVEADACRKDKSAKVWKDMEKYNVQDVKLTTAVFERFAPWFKFSHGYKRINEWLEGKRNKP